MHVVLAQKLILGEAEVAHRDCESATHDTAYF